MKFGPKSWQLGQRMEVGVTVVVKIELWNTLGSAFQIQLGLL